MEFGETRMAEWQVGQSTGRGGRYTEEEPRDPHLGDLLELELAHCVLHMQQRRNSQGQEKLTSGEKWKLPGRYEARQFQS